MNIAFFWWYSLAIKIINFITIILLVISLGFNGYFVLKNQNQNVVTEVIDGDTFKLRNGERIRLLGINAPEMGWCGSEESKNIL